MDKNALIKILVAAAGAAGTSASAQLATGDHVDITALLVGVLTTVVAYLSKQPQTPKV